MRRCWSVPVLALVLAPAPAPVEAQVLDLDRPGAAGPPALGMDTAASERVGVLLAEAGALRRGLPDPDASMHDVILASVNVRALAAELLDEGDRTGAAGSPAVIAGVCLAEGREAIDEVLGRLGTVRLEERREAVIVESLRRFNAGAETLLLDPPTFPVEPNRLDPALAAAFEPLAEAVDLLGGGAGVNQWITPAVLGPGGVTVSGLERLAEAAADAAVGEDVQEALSPIVEYLRRGAAFPQFRPQVEAYALLIAGALELNEVVEGADWITDAQRALCRDRLAAALTLFADPASRSHGEQQLARLAAARGIAERISAVRAAAIAPRQGRSRTSGPQIDVVPIQRAFDALVAAAARSGDGDPRPARLDHLRATLERMIAYRELETPPLTHEMRVVWRKLHDSYLSTENALLAELPRLAQRADALADPSLASLIADQEQYVEDLRRLGELPALVDRIGRLAPRAAGPFGGRARELAAWLGDPSRRPEAVRALDALHEQMADFDPVPFEAELRRGDPAAIVACGGRHERLMEEIDRRRRAWAEAWSAGTEDEAGSLRLLRDLTHAMAVTGALRRAGAPALLLNRWSAWELDEATVGRITGELTSRLKLATNAALESDDAGLREQLERMDLPLAALLARLADVAGAGLAGLPAGAASTLGQCVHPPPPDAWLLARRGDLADLCRYVMEREHARATGRDELVVELDAFVGGLADSLGREIGQ